MTGHYAKWAVYYENAANESDGSAYGLMEFSAKTARVLEIKADLGKIIKAAYDGGDREKIRDIIKTTLPLLKRRVDELREYNRRYWMENIKPLGWEVLDYRYGSLLMNIDTAAHRLNDWLDGKIKNIEELEEPRLSFFGGEELREVNRYGSTVTASRLSMNIHY